MTLLSSVLDITPCDAYLMLISRLSHAVCTRSLQGSLGFGADMADIQINVGASPTAAAAAAAAAAGTVDEEGGW
jgi:hypothetical protein